MEEPTKLYTREEVLSLLSTFQATTVDYLIHTYFQIHNITQGPLYLKHQRRLTNITLNNLSVITKQLTLTVFTRKTYEILYAELASVKYLSCIYPINNQRRGPCPILVQFFDKARGLEVRLLEFGSSPTSLATVLTRHNVIGKVVGYCGDYSYRDPANTKATSDHFNSLRLLSGNEVRDLPYCDNFIGMLFDVLVDYLGPDDITVALDKIGKNVMRLTGNKSQFAKELLRKYTEWSESEQHILLSDYAKFVCENFTALNEYLLPFQRLFKSVATFLSSVLNRFLLVFASEVYQEVDRIKMADNNAIVYYFHLVKIGDLFRTYRDSRFLPPKAWTYLNNEIEYLVSNKQIDPQTDEPAINELFQEAASTVQDFYIRAGKYLAPLLEQLGNFHSLAWVLLNSCSIRVEEVHGTFHMVHKDSGCESCDRLLQEVTHINSVLPKVPLLEISSVAAKWVAVLGKCGEVPMVLDLVEYLLCLPASCEVRGVENGDEYECAKSTIKVNLKGVDAAVVVDGAGEFFGGWVEEASGVIDRNKIPLLLD